MYPFRKASLPPLRTSPCSPHRISGSLTRNFLSRGGACRQPRGGEVALFSWGSKSFKAGGRPIFILLRHHTGRQSVLPPGVPNIAGFGMAKTVKAPRSVPLPRVQGQAVGLLLLFMVCPRVMAHRAAGLALCRPRGSFPGRRLGMSRERATPERFSSWRRARRPFLSHSRQEAGNLAQSSPSVLKVGGVPFFSLEAARALLEATW